MGWEIDGVMVDVEGGEAMGPEAGGWAVMDGLVYCQHNWGNWWGVDLVSSL